MPINYKAPIEIRDGRNGNWFWVDKEIWADERLTASDKVIYGTLAYFANQKNQSAYPSIESLEKFSGVSKRQIYYSLKRLEGFTHILISRQHGKPNVYILLDSGINHLKEQGGAKFAGVQEVHSGGAKSTLQGVQNNTTNNNIYNKNKLTRTLTKVKEGFGNPSINKGIDLLTQFFGYKPSKMELNRFSLNRLFKSRGEERTFKAMEFALSQQKNRYCPVITSYMDLEQKWADLEVYARREFSGSKKGGVIDASHL